MSFNLGTILRESRLNYPQNTAALYGDQKLSYSQMDALACQVAHWLKEQGIKKGDNVALMMPNVPNFTAAYYGILYAGATVVPLNVLIKAQEIKYFLENSRAKSLLCHELFAVEILKAYQLMTSYPKVLIYENEATLNTARPLNNTVPEVIWASDVLPTFPEKFDLIATQADDTAVILYTSGTTGKSKGAELTHFNMYENARFSNERMVMKDPSVIRPYGIEDVALACLPLFHSFGQTVVQNGFLQRQPGHL